MSIPFSAGSFAFAADAPVSVSTTSVSSVASPYAKASEDKLAVVSTAAVSGVEPVSVSAAAVKSEQASDTRQIYDAITDLNYKIEYLKSGYNKTNADVESLRIAVRDQRNAFNDRISALPAPDMSRVDRLEADTASIHSEISQLMADIEDLKVKLDKQQAGK
jgi:peptidoglycan hydrolase CwlO-like protein